MRRRAGKPAKKEANNSAGRAPFRMNPSYPATSIWLTFWIKVRVSLRVAFRSYSVRGPINPLVAGSNQRGATFDSSSFGAPNTSRAHSSAQVPHPRHLCPSLFFRTITQTCADEQLRVREKARRFRRGKLDGTGMRRRRGSLAAVCRARFARL